MTTLKKGSLLAFFIIAYLSTRLIYINSGIIPVEPDEAYYHNSSQSLSERSIPHVWNKPMLFHSPLFEYLAYGINGVVNDAKGPTTFVSTRLVSVLASGALILMVFFYLKKDWSARSAYYSIGFMLITPIILFYSKVGLRDMLLATTMFGFFLAFERLREAKSPLKSSLIAGLLLALAIAAKNGGVIFTLVPIYILVTSYLSKWDLYEKVLKKLKLNWLIFKGWPKNYHYNIPVAVLALGVTLVTFVLPALLTDRRIFKDYLLLSTINHSQSSLMDKVTNFLYYLINLEYWLSLPVLILFIIGTVVIIRSNHQAKASILIFSILISVFLFLSDPSARYFLLITPFIIIAASTALEKLTTKLGSSSTLAKIFVTLTFASIVPNAWVALESTNHNLFEKAVRAIKDQNDTEIKTAYSNFWPPIVQYTLGLPTVRLTTDQHDAAPDHGEFPNYSPEVKGNPTSLIQATGGWALVLKPDIFGNKKERQDAILEIENNHKPFMSIIDPIPNFPERTPVFSLDVYLIKPKTSL